MIDLWDIILAMSEERGPKPREWVDIRFKEALCAKLPRWYEAVKNCDDVYLGPDRADAIDTPCPLCGQQTLFCCRNDFGLIETEPKFAHVCVDLECNYFIELEIQGVSFPDKETRTEYCPWCPEEKWSRR